MGCIPPNTFLTTPCSVNYDKDLQYPPYFNFILNPLQMGHFSHSMSGGEGGSIGVDQGYTKRCPLINP